MADHNDSIIYTYAINFTRAHFNAGVPVTEIHQYLRSNGYPNLERVKIEEWLRENRRSVTSHPAQTIDAQTIAAQTIAAQTTSSNYPNIPPAPADYQTAHHQPTSSSSGGATTGVNPGMAPYSQFLPFDADRFAIEAHRDGRDICWIRDQLSYNNGFEFTLNDVIRILSRQGINSFNASKR